MIPLPSPAEGVAIALDPAEGVWHLRFGETSRRLRPWRWGERRRLVAASTRGGRFDGPAFTAGLAAMLYDPAPPAELAPLHALLALDLLGVGEGPAPAPLAAAEARLAVRFGWMPGALEAEPAAGLDALLAGLDEPAPAPHAPPPGWNSIRVMEEPDG
ncbi:hypothetical protein LPC08_12735 [Roseomonas sp. OT10]|uniref:hypothetical protein n=1 Tax=Roseomonas cutis TaxID=2897332 RepID=UPI001E348D82|nr:hypothetical protein [Roseomonas sp. OT10]UFN46896.1 hypothetical protein LPC08_12735 [Roseomonas sp. OT10]